MDGNIVVMDYSDFDREKARRTLEKTGDFNITEITSVSQFYSSWELFNEVSLIIIDICFPSENEGFEALSSIRAHAQTRNVPVIITTRSDSLEYRDMAAKYSANDFIIKPYYSDRLTKSIRSLVKIEEKFEYSISKTSMVVMTPEQFINREIKLASRSGSPLSIILLTAEQNINDTANESSNLDMVCSIALESVKDTLRSSDLVVFNKLTDIIAMLPYTPSSNIERVLERIKLNVDKCLAALNTSFSDSFTYGCSTYPEDGQDFQTLMKKACKRISAKNMLGETASIPKKTREQAKSKYNKFNRWF